MKKIFFFLLLIQIILFSFGIFFIIKGQIDTGLFNIIINLLGGLFSYYNIKKISIK